VIILLSNNDNCCKIDLLSIFYINFIFLKFIKKDDFFFNGK